MNKTIELIISQGYKYPIIVLYGIKPKMQLLSELLYAYPFYIHCFTSSTFIRQLLSLKKEKMSILETSNSKTMYYSKNFFYRLYEYNPEFRLEAIKELDKTSIDTFVYDNLISSDGLKIIIEREFCNKIFCITSLTERASKDIILNLYKQDGGSVSNLAFQQFYDKKTSLYLNYDTLR